jgi:uncharacterized membrane protein YciS (DUF1049 family)
MKLFPLVLLCALVFLSLFISSTVSAPDPNDLTTAYPSIWQLIATSSAELDGQAADDIIITASDDSGTYHSPGRVDFIMHLVNLTGVTAGFGEGIIVVGGASGNGYEATLDDCWFLSIRTDPMVWSRCPLRSDSEVFIGRYGMGSVVYTNHATRQSEYILSYAGGTDLNYNDDILKLEFLPDGFRWITVMARSADGKDNGPFARAYSNWNFLYNYTTTYDVTDVTKFPQVSSPGPVGREELIYMMGGTGAKGGDIALTTSDDADFDDEWIYSVSLNQWTQQQLYDVSYAPAFPKFPYSNNTNYPPLTEGQQQIVTPDYYLYQFGHFSCTQFGSEHTSQPGCYHNTLYEKNLLTGEFNAYYITDADNSQQQLWPTARAYTAMVYLKDLNWLVIFGGKYLAPNGVETYFSDVAVWDRTHSQWRKLKVTGGGVTQRWSHKMVSIGDDEIIMFGGEFQSTGTQYQPGVWKLSVGLQILPSYLNASGPGLISTVAGQDSTFTIEVRKLLASGQQGTQILSYGNGLDNDMIVEIAGQDPSNPNIIVTQIGSLSDNLDGTYTVVYNMLSGINVIVAIRLFGTEIPGSPFSITLSAAEFSAITSQAKLITLDQGFAPFRADHVVTITPTDLYGNVLTFDAIVSEGAVFKVTVNGIEVPCTVAPTPQAATLDISYNPFTHSDSLQLNIGDSYLLDIQVDVAGETEAIQNSPFRVIVIPGPVLSGDKLIMSEKASLGILSFVFAMIGCMTTVVLLEQAIFDMRSARVPWFTVAASTAISATSFAFCGFWSCIYIGLNQLNVDMNEISIDFKVYTPSAIGSIAIIWVGTLASFGVMVQGFAATNHRKGAVGDAATTTTNTASSNLSDLSTREGRSESKTEGPEKEPQDKVAYQFDSIKSVIWQVVKPFDLRSFLCGLILYGAAIIVEYLQFYSLYGDVDIKFTGTLTAALLVSYVLFVIGFQCFFYLFRFRIAGAAIMAAAIISANQLVYQSTEFYYNNGHNYNYTSNYQPPSTLLIVAAVIGAIACFLLLALQFARLKLSRNLLDIVVKKMRKQLQHANKQIELHQAAMNEAELIYNRYRASVDVISNLRPNYVDSISALLVSCFPLVSPAVLKYVQNPSTAPNSRRSTSLGMSSPGSTLFQTEQLKENFKEIKETVTAEERSNFFKSLSAALRPGSPEYEKVVAFTSQFSLNDFLDNPVTLELFKDALAKEFATENIAFYTLVKQYSSSDVVKEKSIRRLLGAEIITNFILENSPFQINIASAIRKEIINAHKSQGSAAFTRKFFDVACNEVMSLLRRDSFPRFEKTPQYALAGLILASEKLDDVYAHLFSLDKHESMKGAIDKTIRNRFKTGALYEVAEREVDASQTRATRLHGRVQSKVLHNSNQSHIMDTVAEAQSDEAKQQDPTVPVQEGLEEAADHHDIELAEHKAE